MSFLTTARPTRPCVGVPTLGRLELRGERLLWTVSSVLERRLDMRETPRLVSEDDVATLPRFDVVHGVAASEQWECPAHCAEPRRINTCVPEPIVQAMRSDTNFELFALLSQTCSAPAVLGLVYGGHVVGYPFEGGLLRSYRIVWTDHSRELTHDELVALAAADVRVTTLHPAFEALLRSVA